MVGKNPPTKKKYYLQTPNFQFICIFGLAYFGILFFGQNDVNQNIYTLWFLFSSAPYFLSLLH